MKDENPLESSYTEHLEEHVQEYWKNIFETPKDKNPAIDPDGSRHNVNTNPVCLACDMTGEGKPVIRTLANISADKSIFIPVNDAGVSDRELDPGENVNDLKGHAKKDEDSATDVKLTIDGKVYDLKDLKDKQYRIGNPIGPFEVVIPDNPLDGLEPPGKAMAVADGYYLIIKPLAPGEHTIRIVAGVSKPHKENEPWKEDVTYKINVI